MLPPLNPMRRLPSNIPPIRHQSTSVKPPKTVVLLELINMKLQTELPQVDKQKWKELKSDIIFEPEKFNDERITELMEQLTPSLNKNHDRLVKHFEDEFQSLTKKYDEVFSERKEYKDSDNRYKFNDLGLQLSKIIDKKVEILEKQKIFFTIAVDLEKSQKGILNLNKISEYENELGAINQKLGSLKTKQASNIILKDLSSSNDAIKEFDRQNSELVSKLRLVIPEHYQDGFFKDSGMIYENVLKVREAHDADIEKNLLNASSQLLKYLDNPHVEEDLRVELKKLESMLGSKTPSHDIAITKNIRKIKIRLAVLDSLRDVKDIIASGKLNATGAQILGYMLIATTSYKNHDINFISRLLVRFTDFMRNNPIKAVTTPPVLYLLAVFLANCFILSELAALAETKLNAETNELGLNTNEVLLQAAKYLGIDLSTTTYE
nr:hypothetical protein [Parachlamydiaceae bacterium]